MDIQNEINYLFGIPIRRSVIVSCSTKQAETVQHIHSEKYYYSNVDCPTCKCHGVINGVTCNSCYGQGRVSHEKFNAISKQLKKNKTMIIYRKEEIDEGSGFGNLNGFIPEMVTKKITIYFLGIPVYTTERKLKAKSSHRA